MEPQKRRLYFASTPRPCGEMTSGIAGWRLLSYHEGSTRYAGRTTPLCAWYENLSVFTPACAPGAIRSATTTAVRTRGIRTLAQPGTDAPGVRSSRARR